MEFIKEFKPNKYSYGYKAIVHSKSGDFDLVILAGSSSHSEPQEDDIPIENYTSFEMSIWNTKTDKSASLNEIEKVVHIIGKGDYETKKSRNGKKGVNVFSYVSKENIQKVLDIL